MRQIDLNLLRVFDILLAERSVTRTAIRLSLKQSSISSALNRLRSAINDQLFVRGEGGLVPTSTALALAEPVRQALRDIDKAVNTCARFSPSKSQEHMRLRGDDGTLSRLLPRLLPIIEREAPLLTLDISSTGDRNNFEHLRTGELDLLIATIDRTVPENLLATRLYGEKLHAVACPMAWQSMSLVKFATADLIFCELSHAESVDAALAESRPQQKKRLVIESYLLAAVTAASTGRICVLPEAAAALAIEQLGLALFPLPIDLPERNVSMIWHERAHHNAAHRWLRGQISAIRQEPLSGLATPPAQRRVRAPTSALGMR
jgi:DNA-binding transcriptional LysR family regulator